MYKICIVTQTHLVDNPRVVKEANTLKSNGYIVDVITTFSSLQKLNADKKLNTSGFNYSAAVNLIPGESSKFYIFFYKVVKKIGSLLFKWSRISTPFSLFYGPNKFLSVALKCNADLYIGHTETGLWVCNQLAKHGKKVSYDFEDWYSQDYFNKYRPIKYLRQLEKEAFKFGEYVTCPSIAMALALSDYYKVSPPSVLYNGFSLTENKNKRSVSGVRSSYKRISFCWFSQTIGPGRGLEFLVSSLNKISFSYEFHLWGNCSDTYRQQLLSLHKPIIGQEILFHPPVPHSHLLPLINEQDVGLALELNSPPSRNYTITNKILQYLQGGVAIICSDTKGQQEVASLCRSNIYVFNHNNKASLSDTLNIVNTLYSEGHLHKEIACNDFKKYFSWEVQEETLLRLVKHILL